MNGAAFLRLFVGIGCNAVVDLVVKILHHAEDFAMERQELVRFHFGSLTMGNIIAVFDQLLVYQLLLGSEPLRCFGVFSGAATTNVASIERQKDRLEWRT